MDSIDETGETEDLIPGLPNDLALKCLAKISHGYHGLLKSVSKKWRNAIKSSDYANLKAREGWCGNWLFVSTRTGRKSQWNAYDPDAGRWHPLPSSPGPNYDSLNGCSCVTVCKKFLVIGGFYMASCQKTVGMTDVNMFNPYKQQWSRMSSMQNARAYFACAAIGDKVYVAGGSTSTTSGGLSAAEVYDPYMDRWDDLPPMPFSLTNCFSISYGIQFHVVGKEEINSGYDRYLIFNPEDQKWHIVEDLWPFSKLARECIAAAADGYIYTILDDGSVNILDTDSKNWCKIGYSPLIFLPNHDRPLKLFGFSLIGFKGYLYVIGGMALRYDSNAHAYDVVEVNTVKFCDLLVPLKWQDVRAMPGPSSGIVGCALLEE